MAKFLIVLAISIVIFIYFNYPLYSKDFSYLIVFGCFVVIIFAGTKLWTEREINSENYETVEKEQDKKRNNDGKFKYINDGFYFTQKDATELIKYEEIIEVNAFSIPIGRYSKQSGLEVITKNKSFEFNDNNTIGIEKFGDKLFENLPNWRLNTEFIRVNNYGLEKRNLYKKNGSG